MAPNRRLSNGMPLDDHLPALLLIERRAFWPFLFDNPSQQPMRDPAPVSRPGHARRRGRRCARPRPGGRIDLCGYDYVLLLGVGDPQELARLAPDRLQLLDRADFAALLRVRPARCRS